MCKNTPSRYTTLTQEQSSGILKYKSRKLIVDLPDYSDEDDPRGIDYEPNQYFYHQDHIGSSSYLTDDNGEVHEFFAYFPSGELFVEQNSAGFGTSYKFTGKELDTETGLYYFGARYYDPRTQVWQSPDPILSSYLDGQRGMGGVYNPVNLGLYTYAGNNPINLIDPDGRSISDFIDNAIGAEPPPPTEADIPRIINEMREFEAKGRAHGLDLAPHNINHFLNGSGNDIKVRYEFLKQYNSVNSAQSLNQNRLIANDINTISIPDHIMGLKDGQTVSFSEYFIAPIQASKIWETDLYFGSGGSELVSTGVFTANRKGQRIYVSGKVSHVWRDKYNWDKGKKTQVGFFFGPTFRDNEANYLVDMGKAANFDMSSSWSNQFNGTYNLESKGWDSASFK